MSETGSTRQEYPPGSDEARAHGCTCPVLDNGHGHGAGMLDGETVSSDREAGSGMAAEV